MKRRQFCQSAVAAGVVFALPACGRNESSSTSLPQTIDAVSLDGNELGIERAAVSELAESLHGRLYLSGDDGYDTARKIWNGMFDDRRPAMVVQCAAADDVRNAVLFARDRNLLLSVKGGGHSFPGKSVAHRGMMLDLSPMHAVNVNVDAGTATVGGGALLGHLDSATLEHHMATTAGIVSHTGVGGFTLGGGMGRTDRLHGLAIDNLLSASVATADGRLLRASADDNPDLFWAIRGGGGNFGVVTEFEFGLHAFDPTVYAGVLVFPFDAARDLIRVWAGHRDDWPRELNAEPSLFVSPEGERIAMLEICYAGDPADGEKAIAPLLAVANPVAGELGPMSYQAMQTMYDAATAHGQLNYMKSGLIGEITEPFIDAMVGNYDGEYLPWAWFQHLGGAISDVGPTDTAYVHREAGYNNGLSATWQDAAESEARIAAIRAYYKELAPFMGGFYTNLNEDTEARTWGNYRENYPRLSEIKAKYDPTNLFRMNANIQPASKS